MGSIVPTSEINRLLQAARAPKHLRTNERLGLTRGTRGKSLRLSSRLEDEPANRVEDLFRPCSLEIL